MINFANDIQPTIHKIEELLGLSIKVFIVTAVLVIFLGVYIANLVFGNNSLQVLQNLQREKHVLQQEIDGLKKENAALHKEYLEWRDAQK
ncbi:MAG TPA: hypothetical protein ENK86_03445 [Campylobacterales bacterium]|nr:hypothetical protein [Campylobacterales bacterium]